ncbi:hypothetical protein AYO21_06231 [Fonsecaea monophora]|uniref:Uncharacterized protein n=1 Tax=Fonsecaea monophora TaxID=254056 RepID=A0A177F5V8_9EURO|nr:hypothetical protein AYO21_06231 [Fonsecaea monophora]OAG39587.1 hypothetical protein AYO21_06231 [Fonsecaea monophora]
MRWIASFKDLQLDIVGIIAVLGEGSITRNAQATSLSWWSTLPRLMPAPHALLEHERKYRLPTAPGIVTGAYSGMMKRELNFFAQLLHPEPLEDYQVELVQVTEKERPAGTSTHSPFGPKKYGALFWISVAGSAMTLALIGLSVYYHDGFSLLATIMLSMVSSFVGFGTHWNLVFQQPRVEVGREGVIPRSDVVIYYPNGSIRVIRPTSEQIALLYFQLEYAQYAISDTLYRTLALLSTVMLMTGVVCLANASNILQVTFAASYILLNVLYWAVSALNPFRYHWQHAYDVEIMPVQYPQNQGFDAPIAISRVEELEGRVRKEWRRFQKGWAMERGQGGQGRAHGGAKAGFKDNEEARDLISALWTAIVLTGTSQWLNEATSIAPMNAAWREWLREADTAVQPRLEDGVDPGRPNDEWDDRFRLHCRPRIQTGLDWTFTPATRHHVRLSSRRRRFKLKSWDYQGQLTGIFGKHAPRTRMPLEDEIVSGDAEYTGGPAGWEQHGVTDEV